MKPNEELKKAKGDPRCIFATPLRFHPVSDSMSTAFSECFPKCFFLLSVLVVDLPFLQEAETLSKLGYEKREVDKCDI